MYNHPLGFALYNLNHSKDAIKVLQKAIIFEGEKSTLLYASYFGLENDISVAVCGSSLITYQVELLLSLGVKEIIIAFDKQFQDVNDDEGKRWIKKLKDIHKKYSSKCQISFMFDKKGLLGYKDSPIDAGIETFLTLFKERIIL
jgi:DNA primase